ncbi:hypothetical protein FGE12_26275 [Aggregicoccus sp. 17bor-14]|uniref:hypothetical protein n=1 Tax=Myxococcaceae TaxID=31 RepID=UPI00129C69C9|nr:MULTISPECIES: hypothetical protein [Myxococcaceae]MBF5045946.1 hypothetical protein [Simulacricoccus sp. 17bor-14]MRI91678.1 hypothetical protein [Aggregicoccus sp. 17bor-14]
MAYRIALAPELAELVAELPRSVLRRIDAQLERVAALAELMPPEAPCWAPFRAAPGSDLHFYAGDCCVRFELHADARCVWVRSLGRIRLGFNARHSRLAVPGTSA